jgi:hypothetical protein
MRANEIIRSLLDLIDGVEQEPVVQIAIEPIDAPEDEFDGDDIRRFKQIIDLASDETDGTNSPFSNTPNEKVADIDAVTKDAGGGWMAPKHPSDIRVQHPSAYPGHQHKVGE